MVGGVRDARRRDVEALEVGEDRLLVLALLLRRVGVVEAEQHLPVVPLREVCVEEARLDVADVQLARRLGREARHHLAVDGVGQVDHHVACVLLRAEEALRDREAAQGETWGTRGE